MISVIKEATGLYPRRGSNRDGTGAAAQVDDLRSQGRTAFVRLTGRRVGALANMAILFAIRLNGCEHRFPLTAQSALLARVVQRQAAVLIPDLSGPKHCRRGEKSRGMSGRN